MKSLLFAFILLGCAPAFASSGSVDLGSNVTSGGGGGSGTVTSITAGSGLSGGTITTSGTIALATIASHTILSNVTGSSAVPSANTLSAILDAAIASSTGAMIYRGPSGWQSLTIGTNGQCLEVVSGIPAWTACSGGGGSSSGPANAVQLSDGSGGFTNGALEYVDASHTIDVAGNTLTFASTSRFSQPATTFYPNVSPTDAGIVVGAQGPLSGAFAAFEAWAPSGTNIAVFLSNTDIHDGGVVYKSMGTGASELQGTNSNLSNVADLFVQPEGGFVWLGHAALKWPNVDGGPGTCLQTDGAQTLSWGSCGGGGGAPGGSNGQFQFNNSAAFGGSANFTYSSGSPLVANNVFLNWKDHTGAALPVLKVDSFDNLQIGDTTGPGNVAVETPSSIFVFPTTSGTSGQVLTNLGGGGTVWASPSLVTNVPNNTWLTWRNAANTADINVLKVDGSDNGQLGDAGASNSFSLQSASSVVVVSPSFVISTPGAAIPTVSQYNGSNAHHIDFTVSNSQSTNWAFTWPQDAGSASQSLQTNGSGVTSWSYGPAGTVCGWNDGILTVNCLGVDPGSSCPSGYTQRSSTVLNVKFCTVN